MQSGYNTDRKRRLAQGAGRGESGCLINSICNRNDAAESALVPLADNCLMP
jgi:hypothetical protein